MFSLFKKKLSDSPGATVLPYTVDMHSHILPGIDDGAPDSETSLELIKGLYAIGVRKCIATPHIIGDLYRNTPATINAALAVARETCANAGVEMELQAAAEYMLDDYFMELLQQDQPLLTLQGNYLLTEFSYTMRPQNIDEMVFAIITSGYQPVLAHPERYFYMHPNLDEYRLLKDLGFHLQVNLLSLTGYYGKSAAKAARYILDNELASFAGTDLHHKKHLAALQEPGNLALFGRYLGKKAINKFI